MTTALFGGAGGKLGCLKAQTLNCVPLPPAVSSPRTLSPALRAHLAFRAHGQPSAHPSAGCDGDLPVRQRCPACARAGPPLTGSIVKGGERPARLRREPLTRQKQGGLSLGRQDGADDESARRRWGHRGCESSACQGQEDHRSLGTLGQQSSRLHLQSEPTALGAERLRKSTAPHPTD